MRGNDKRNKPDRLLVSKGKGTKFVSVKIPTTSSGSADDVIALDYDKNGLVDFVVLNGRIKAGPIQLLASFPRSIGEYIWCLQAPYQGAAGADKCGAV